MKKQPVHEYFVTALGEKSSEHEGSVGRDQDTQQCIILLKDQAILCQILI